VRVPRPSRGGGPAPFGAALVALLLMYASPALAAPALAIGSARFGNVFVAGEPLVLSVTVTASPDQGFRGRLRLRAVDVYGRSAGRTSKVLKLAPGASITQDFAIRRPRLGHFTVDATAVDRTRHTTTSVTATAAMVPPLDSSSAEDSGVGYFILPDDSELDRADAIASEMRRFGIRWVRFTFPWWTDTRVVRPDLSDPAWLNSASFERWVDAFRANGIEVVGVLFGMARWASEASDQVEPLAGVPAWGLAAPRDLSDWELFVRTLATRMRGRVSSWEVWNEPDIDVFWVSSLAEYITIARATAGVLREIDPANRVVVNLVDRETSSGTAFYDTVLAEDAGVLDVFGLHYGNTEWVADEMAARPLLRPGGEIWNTEAYGAPRRHISWWLWQRAAGVARIFPFIYHTLLDDSSLDTFKRFGGYPVNLDYTPRPDAVAFRTMSDLVGSATPTGGGSVGLGYDAYTFVGPAGSVVALTSRNDFGETWSVDSAVDLMVRVPRVIRRVTVGDLMGNRQTLRVHKGTLKLRLLGVAAFFLQEPGQSLDGLQVIRSRAARAH
jgi:hypothetical protein